MNRSRDHRGAHGRNGVWHRPPPAGRGLPIAPTTPPRTRPVPGMRGMDAGGGCLVLLVPLLGAIAAGCAAVLGGAL